MTCTRDDLLMKIRIKVSLQTPSALHTLTFIVALLNNHKPASNESITVVLSDGFGLGTCPYTDGVFP